MEHESDGDTNCNWGYRYCHQRTGTGLGNKRTRGDLPNYSFIEISQNTKESPGDLKKTCCHSKTSEKPSAKAGVKNSQKIIIIIIIIIIRRIRKLLETKLCSRYLMRAINTWILPFVWYSRPFLKWTREELKQMNQRIKKLMTMRKELHPRDEFICIKKGRRKTTCQHWR